MCTCLSYHKFVTPEAVTTQIFVFDMHLVEFLTYFVFKYILKQWRH